MTGRLRFPLLVEERQERGSHGRPGVPIVSQKKSAKIQHHFVKLTDPRRRKVTYPLINIVVIAVCAVICGADDFVAIADFGRTKRKWFARFLDLKSGIPSHDRFNASWPGSSQRSLSNVCSVGSRRCTRSPRGKWWPSTARRCAAVSTRRRARRRSTWSAPGPRRIRSAWAKSWWTPRATRSRQSRNCWKSSIFRGPW